MKSFSIYTAVAILAAALSYAAPVELESRNNAVTITFQGAPPNVAFYTRSIPIDGSVVELSAFPLFFLSTHPTFPPFFFLLAPPPP